MGYVINSPGTVPRATCVRLFFFRFSIAMQTKKSFQLVRTVFPSFFFSFPFFLFFFSKNAGFFFQVARGAIIGFSARVFQADATIRPAIFFKDLLKNISEIYLEGKLTGKAQTVCLELQSWIKLLRKLHSWGHFF